jgi:hypothetical protein
VKGFEERGLCFREGRPVKGSLVGLTDTDLAESGNVQKSLDLGVEIAVRAPRRFFSKQSIARR